MNQRWPRIAFLLVAALVGAAALRVSLPAKTVEADIREVWMHREAYLGKSLRVSGTLKRFLKDLPKDHFAVESSDGFRIGVEAPELVRLEGRQVTAEGTAVFDEIKGLRLAPASVTAR